jgi:hypothetical protein
MKIHNQFHDTIQFNSLSLKTGITHRNTVIATYQIFLLNYHTEYNLRITYHIRI